MIQVIASQIRTHTHHSFMHFRIITRRIGDRVYGLKMESKILNEKQMKETKTRENTNNTITKLDSKKARTATEYN